MRTGLPHHLPAFDYIGFYRYFLTFCTLERRPLFTNREVVDLALDQIRRAAESHRFALSAYCFMPDHLHLLVESRHEASNALKFIALSKQLTGFHYRKRLGGTLWQRYGYERVLRDEDETLSVARYILENPVRAGLVEDVKTYP